MPWTLALHHSPTLHQSSPRSRPKVHKAYDSEQTTKTRGRVSVALKCRLINVKGFGLFEIGKKGKFPSFPPFLLYLVDFLRTLLFFFLLIFFFLLVGGQPEGPKLLVAAAVEAQKQYVP